MMGKSQRSCVESLAAKTKRLWIQHWQDCSMFDFCLWQLEVQKDYLQFHVSKGFLLTSELNVKCLCLNIFT
ncbi:hypothetical protein MtrunA17_Chr8g0352781 [Medicago truncatula]|uniref:Uncharacterized protein n=1 Tax=Medicago truncatula TaxID=3880 RepID=A0A396GG51_MEDTR|nr:hypothetical protein MtrunA17_Chr8g0352781 [Medicago truncatula]